MTVFRSDYSRHTSPSATSQHYTNTDFRGKPDPSLNRPREDSKLVYSSALNITIFADPIVVSVTQHGLLSQWPAVDRDPTLDQEFDCEYWEAIPTVTIELGGTWFNETIFADPIVVTISLPSSMVLGIIIPTDPIVVTVSLKFTDAIIEYPKSNWVKWSKIGNIDFTIDESNVAGERPLNWHGFVYGILRLNDTLVAYGESGVTVLVPKDVAYGMEELYNIGLLGKSAVTGTKSEHFFIDVSGKLFKVSSKGLEELGYSEFLSQLTDPAMSLDLTRNLLYICDGTYGYIYNTKDESFGSGPVSLTGIGSRGNTRYAVAPSTITIPKFEICTDIYDMGTRKAKNIHSVEVGTDLSQHLELLIEYRISNRGEFKSSPWFLVNPDGIAYSPCYGIEFRFRLRSFITEWFQIDRLKINGSIHGFSHRDYLAMTRQSL
jgi:hypothetical protein